MILILILENWPSCRCLTCCYKEFHFRVTHFSQLLLVKLHDATDSRISWGCQHWLKWLSCNFVKQLWVILKWNSLWLILVFIITLIDLFYILFSETTVSKTMCQRLYMFRFTSNTGNYCNLFHISVLYV